MSNGTSSASYLILVLLISCVLGLVPAFIAQSKGHNFVTWWFFGAALFILALPMSLMVSDVRVRGHIPGYVPAAPAGWYDRPEGGKRYWDGARWTEHTAP